MLTDRLGQLTRQILPVVGAAPTVSMPLDLARGGTVMTFITPAVAFGIGAVWKPARDSHHGPCYKLMAAFHKRRMNRDRR